MQAFHNSSDLLANRRFAFRKARAIIALTFFEDINGKKDDKDTLYPFNKRKSRAVSETPAPIDLSVTVHSDSEDLPIVLIQTKRPRNELHIYDDSHDDEVLIQPCQQHSAQNDAALANRVWDMLQSDDE